MKILKLIDASNKLLKIKQNWVENSIRFVLCPANDRAWFRQASFVPDFLNNARI